MTSTLGLEENQTVFKRLQLLHLLDSGGFAEVWQARDLEVDDLVALKFIRRASKETDEAWALLKQELLKLRRCAHQHVVRVHQLHDDGSRGLAAIEMELLAGGTVDDKLKRAPNGFFHVETVRPWVEQLCVAMTHVHQFVVHRDLKPKNLMFDDTGQLKIMDFGIARRLVHTDGTPTRFIANNVGTVAYASPEQLAGEEPTVGDDIYAIGVILYHLLTGQLPIEHSDQYIMMGMVARNKPVPPNERLRKLRHVRPIRIPAAWEETILQCLAKSRAQRPKSAADIWDRLNRPLTKRRRETSNWLYQFLTLEWLAPQTINFGICFENNRLTICSASDDTVVIQPAVVAVRTGTRQIVAVGEEAVARIDESPQELQAVYPVREEVIADHQAAEALLRKCFSSLVNKRDSFYVIATVPIKSTDVEREALVRAIAHTGARRVRLIEHSFAVALQEDLPVTENSFSAVIYVGDDSTEMALIAQSKIFLGRSVEIGDRAFDYAITQHMKYKHSLVVSELQARQIKLSIGSAYPAEQETSMEVTGHDVTVGLPKTLRITSQEIREALLDPLSGIFDCIRSTFERCSPQMSGDIADRGIILAGIGARLRGFDHLLKAETDLAVQLTRDSDTTLAEGAAKAFEVLRSLRASFETTF